MHLNKNKIQELLKARFKGGFLTLRDFPHPDKFHDMYKACEIIIWHIQNKKKITVVGDYDVDGVVSSALMKYFFDFIHYEVEVIIPNRFRDGYGLSEKIIDRIESDLIITVDNGISATKAAQKCKEKDIMLIITDHHTPPKELPQADAIVNPKLQICEFEYSEICGAQVVWYLIAKLNKLMDLKIDMKELIGMTSIAVVADVMPLKDINRTFVKAGLEILSKSSQPFVLALKQNMAKTEFTAQDLGFFIAPKLNSAGRMEDAILAYRFLSAKNLEIAIEILNELNAMNNYRKDIQNQIIDEAMQQVRKEDNIIVVEGNWHEGVIGIVASFLVQKFQKPTIVFSKTESKYKGSARSYGDIDLFEIIHRYKNLLQSFGGHKAAAGLSIEDEKYESFKSQITQEQIENTSCEDFCLGEICFSTIDWQLVEILQRYEPYGEQNPKPTFISKGVEVVEFKRVGEQKEHLIIHLKSKSIIYKAIQFKSQSNIKVGDRVDIEYSIEKNNFQNQTSIQLQILKLDL